MMKVLNFLKDVIRRMRFGSYKKTKPKMPVTEWREIADKFAGE
jgi:hypothetical protein